MGDCEIKFIYYRLKVFRQLIYILLYYKLVPSSY